MVTNRALEPMSKLALEEWVGEDTAIEDLNGVEVHQLYLAMDFLLESTEEIQREVYCSVSNLLNLEVDLLYFDTTSTYFEVEAPDEGDSLRQYGHSKDRRPDRPQAVIGLAATRDGIPVRSWVWPGNTADVSVIDEVKDDLVGWKFPEGQHTKAACALCSHPTYGKYLRQLKNGQLRIHRSKIKEQQRLDGKYLVRTSDDTLDPEDVAPGLQAAGGDRGCFSYPEANTGDPTGLSSSGGSDSRSRDSLLAGIIVDTRGGAGCGAILSADTESSATHDNGRPRYLRRNADAAHGDDF